ncbi:MAG: asparagine synthase-related protein [Pseudomonadota bacterium]|jgi:GMP synthase (glutamine-hydrolysing)|nr:ExsB family transcriptional regulator [Syntrophaceae bacterium]MBP7032868.1 ExsB family transcriptional regulator [Syntrophobacterales bacterium]MDI9554273.1 asparagine synthase-related protein [Pseudomonadota bacterium]NLX32470.1 ExsB family transcriptional regulator [Deltaproteobacteria bacterium]HNU85785.1 asparagine synthase-related protein [Syntrophales bacterium]
MKHRGIEAKDLKPKKFIDEKVREIREIAGGGIAISALSGGVDSSVVTALAHRALGRKLKTYLIDNGIMREGEPRKVKALFAELGIPVTIVNARQAFFDAMRGITDPELKREAITQTFYKKVFRELVLKSKATTLLQGTILTDVEETAAGIKRQHNVFEQIGIDPRKAFGYRISEPLIELRKDGVRKVGIALGLQKSLFDRIPFPGPALAARVIGEVTPAKIALVRRATVIVEEELQKTKAFQYMAILHEDRVTGIREGRRDFGLQIEVRCWDSVDARTASPTRLPWSKLERIASRILEGVPGVVSVTYNLATKPPSTIEAI